MVIIMCGGTYNDFKEHKALSIINGERLIERTIRLLKQNGIEDIYISSNDNAFNKYGNVLHHNNTFKEVNNNIEGYWVDAYYPTDKPCIYLHGDVYYSEDSIKKILNLNPKINTFIGNQYALNKEHIKVGEPFGWIIVDQKRFRKAIEETKRLYDNGKCHRHPISWEVYQVLYGHNINDFIIEEESYLAIKDETDDIDSPEKIDILDNKIKSL
jgi:choline kinase